jgi:hypothetical protein
MMRSRRIVDVLVAVRFFVMPSVVLRSADLPEHLPRCDFLAPGKILQMKHSWLANNVNERTIHSLIPKLFVPTEDLEIVLKRGLVSGNVPVILSAQVLQLRMGEVVSAKGVVIRVRSEVGDKTKLTF